MCLIYLRFHTALGNVALVGIHTKPEAAVEELNQLDDAVERVMEHWSVDKVRIAINRKNMENIKLYASHMR